MAYGKLWPAHPKPFHDEILSSWIVRVADSNGVKLQRMCWGLFGNEKSPWNRDVDRSAPSWLLSAMCEHTGVKYWDAYHSTLNVYRLKLFGQRRWSGHLTWILPLNHHGMKLTGKSGVFCPKCLAGDAEPYFRRCWRVALFNFCPSHNIKMLDGCPECGEPVGYYRKDFGKELWEAKDIACCWSCGFDYRQAEPQQPRFYSSEIQSVYTDALNSLIEYRRVHEQFDGSFFGVLHHLVRAMTTNLNHGKFEAYLSDRLGVDSANIKLGRESIEVRSLEERHHLLMLGLWLMVDLRPRLTEAWRNKAIRYNLMTKDMKPVPKWYGELVGEFSDWRLSNNCCR